MFDRSVNEALTSTTNRLENMQDFRLINHFAFGDTIQFLNRVPIPPPPPPPANLRYAPKRIIIPKSPGNPSARQIEMIVKAGKNKNGFQYQISTQTDSSTNEREENIIFINTDSLGKNLVGRK